ncbi:MAG: hypothetical protein IPO81_20025 [Kouleothrix sp.]|nr:hypothetical protein [Kouleothrix sp.]
MTVAEIMEQAKALSVQERKELVKRLVDTLDTPVYKASPQEKHSILELAGLGAEVWKDIDAQEYVDQLRSEWDELELDSPKV